MISKGKPHVLFALDAIKVIRQLGCILPIQIFYSGKNDLEDIHIKEFESMSGVSVEDITLHFNNEVLRLSGWAIKPFCILASKFQQVILIDADTIFLSNPAKIFQDPDYKRTGTMFYLDRTLFPNVSWQREWLESFLPFPVSRSVAESRYFNMKTAHEQDSAVVAIDKAIAFEGLIAVCNMNSFVQRENIYKKVHGDKETFWIGFEMIEKEFSFSKYLPAAVGPITKQSEPDSAEIEVCGKVLHFDTDGRPFWWNGGLVFDKYTTDGMKKYFNAEGWSEEGEWHFESSCMKKSQVHKFTEGELMLVDEFKRIWNENRRIKQESK